MGLIFFDYSVTFRASVAFFLNLLLATEPQRTTEIKIHFVHLNVASLQLVTRHSPCCSQVTDLRHGG